MKHEKQNKTKQNKKTSKIFYDGIYSSMP